MSIRRFTPVLIHTLCALLLMGLALTGISLGQTPPPATFVNPTLFNGGSVISNYSPIPVNALAFGDFNNDGFPDLLTLDDNGNTAGVGIMLGNGAGGFGTVSSITTFACTLEGGIVTGDFNNDGNLDFAVISGTNGGDCNFNPGTLWIYLGNGAGGFTLKASYSMLGGPAYHNAAGGLVTADLRSNGHLDLLAIDPNNGIDVFLGNGDGTFVAPTAAVALTCPGCSNSEAVWDVNHDGKPDLVVASNNSSDGIFVLLGKGDGTFQTPVFYPQGSNSGALAVAIGQLIKGDNGDVVMGTGNGAYVYLNNGDGTFKTPVLYGPSWINSITITDINGDKKNDLVVSSYSSSAVWTMLGNGKGGFTAGESFATSGYPNNVVVADFNSDKKLDFATSNNSGEWITVGLGNGDGTFRSSQSFGYTWSGTVAQIATADLNDDGNLDIVEAGGGTGVGITVMLGTSHGAFGSPISTAVGCGQANRGGVNAIALGDVTGDGKVDVVATMTNSGGGCPNNEVAVLAGLGTGKFKAPALYSTGVTVQSGPVALADLRGGGKLDIVTSNADGSLSVLLNNGKGIYGAANVITGASGSDAGNIVVGDFNHDGKLDLAITNYSGTAVNVLLGNGDGSFQPPILTPSPINPVGLTAGDFNNDGKLDLALTSWNNNGSLQIFSGNGDGTFTLGTLYKFNAWVECYPSGGTNPYWLSAGDLNQDGKLDLAIAVTYTQCGTEYSGEQDWGAALVYTGNGDGTFNLEPGPFLGGVDNSGIVLGDFNRDGMLDMAVAGNAAWTSQDWVTIMLNNTQPVSVSPLALTYKAQVVETKSAAQTVLFTNDESTSLAVSKVALGGADPGDFTFKSECPGSLLAGEYCTVSVTFEPTTPGSRTATLSITDGDGTQNVALTGTGEQTITSFTPTSGTVGTAVTITGTAFTGTTKVTFGGVASSFTVNSETQITATVPTGAKTGKIAITTNGETVDSKTSFTVN
ncbi:MAG: FG-GAP-like repeat-containing protein [Terriglobales bacterium]|jgi:VCBS repeat protein/IPT/TIG domain-containing protein/FG-GAP repeat protein